MEYSSQNQYKIVLVALDLTEMDDALIKYTAMMSNLLSIERIYFVHVVKSLELPDDLLEKYPDLMAPLDESILNDVKGKVEPHFTDQKVEIDYLIQEGNPIETMLKLSKIKEIDLIVMGRKRSLKGSGIITSHIARKSPCSLLLVPETDSAKLEHIMLPIDFSSHSQLAITQALQFATEAKSKVTCAHVYKVPIGFYKTGKSFKEFAEIMKGHAENDFRQFIRKHQFPSELPCEFLLTDDGKHAELIYNKAAEIDIDLIMIGSKGRTKASSMLMGSLAEKIVYQDQDIPVLIVKNKGENMGFLEALLRL